MAAMAGASGVRSWLQAHHVPPRRLKQATIGLTVVALAVPTVKLTGSTQPPDHAAKPAAATAQR